MSKNLIDSKSIHVNETLFEEILNGFSEIKEKHDKESIRLATIQRKRLVNVGEAFLKNKATNIFTKEWVGRLSGSSYEEKILQLIIQNEDDDEDDIEVDEKEDKKVNDVFSPLKAFRFLSMMRNLYAAYQIYNKVKGAIQDYSNISLQIEDRGLADKNTRIIQQVRLINKMFEEFLLPIVKMGGRSLVYYIENNKFIDALFNKVDEFIQDQQKRFVISLGVDAVLSIVPILGQAKWVNYAFQGSKLAWRTYKWTNLIYNAAVYYNYYTNGLAGVTVDEKETESLATAIHNQLTVPFLEPQYRELEKKIDNFLEGIDSALDVSNYIEERKDDFMSDVNQVRRLTNLVRPRGSRNEVNTNSPTVSFNSTYNLQTKSYEVSPLLQGVGNSIISSLADAHSRRFNFIVDESFDDLFDEQNGVIALVKLRELKNGIQPIIGDFYSQYYSFIDAVRDGLIEKIDSYSKFVQPLEQIHSEVEANNPAPTREQILDQFRGETATVNQPPQQPPTITNSGQLRLSERSLQPIHPIFTNNAMTGIELELLDSEDNQISIKVPNWNNPGDKIELAPESKLDLINNYLKFHADYDIVKDEYLKLLEEEQSFNQNVQVILDELTVTIDRHYGRR